MENQSKTIKAELNVAYCGLYCSGCSKYKKGKCPGCQKNEKATWCKIRKCCIENNYKSCAECDTYASAKECKLYNNFIANTIEFFTNTDRSLCIEMIKKEGEEKFVEHMIDLGKMSLPKRKSK